MSSCSRKFLLVAHGASTSTELAIKLDGVAVGTVTTTPRGKVMINFLDGDFRVAGTCRLTLIDANVMQADFFPGID